MTKPLNSKIAAFAALIFAPVFFFSAPALAADNSACMDCHGRKKPGFESAPAVKASDLASSRHAKEKCVACHTDATPGPHQVKPAKINCRDCHAKVASKYDHSIHGKARADGESEAATCQDCHAPGHKIVSKANPESSIYPFRLPETCARCHANPVLAQKYNFPQDVLKEYYGTIHGRALVRSGLLVTAVCTNCHGSDHNIQKHTDPNSTIGRNHVVETCGKCHAGIAAVFKESIHGKKLAEGSALAPVCTTCHSAHRIVRTDAQGYQLQVVKECGDCHGEYLATYRDTYHGKITRLGYTKVARCSDCHSAHNIQKVSDARSSLSPANKIDTCRKCHPKANENFIKYIAHSTSGKQVQFRVMFWTILLMSALLIGTFAFFGVHTLMWLARLVGDIKKKRHEAGEEPAKSGQYYFRFKLYHRILHGIIITSFLGLVLTGMPMKFSHTWWASFLARLFGGFEAMGFLHRFFALLTFLYFGLHLSYAARYIISHREFRVFGPDSMIPRLKDLQDFIVQIKWFIGKGPRPRFDRWTYWEKFDYWAVFWGISIIGTSGLVLWFPEFFAAALPGWVFNVATVVHSDEALLASGFIFTIHFFHTHLRPGKFPMDDVIFTGRISLEEMKEERPEEYERLLASGELEALKTEPTPEWLWNFARIIGFTALTIGVVTVLLIIVAVFAPLF